MDIYDKFAALRAAYPEDTARIEAEQEAMKKLLERQQFASLPVTQELLALCRKDILTARLKLATERTLSEEIRDALWGIVDARLWFVELITKDYRGELKHIEQMVEAELVRF